MTTSSRCVICGNSNMRRLIELGWNNKMSTPALVSAFGGVPSSSQIVKHLKEHTEGAWGRNIDVPETRPIRLRVLAIQEAQIEAIERQLFIAQERAANYNEEFRGTPDYDPALGQPEWYFNLLSKDMQAAISSILKAQGLTDKRELKTDANRIDMFRLMAGGKAPAGLIASGPPIIEGEAVEVPDE